ncbi:hypothetical protein FOL47_000723 [Perkinsus chesapeaki]|uniref:Uncharacterized protein n=1 Tax=Perkinsus chesapeaki TaxID=330153 RepID=A0A7J6ML04_PERCH|nr:hypothetical protein FOL47_000723 [Perkinsus chesapeaki]
MPHKKLRAAGPVYDSKLLWRAVLSSRRLFAQLDPGSQLGTIPIPLSASEYQATQPQLDQGTANDITLNTEGVTFGYEYLKMLDAQRNDDVVKEWLEEKEEKDSCDSDEEADASSAADDAENLVLDVMDDGQGLGEEEEFEFEEEESDAPADILPDQGELAFQAAAQSGRPKRKLCRLKSLHTTTHSVKLNRWSDSIRGVVRNLSSEAPVGHGCAAFVYRAYLRKTLEEVDDALLTGRKPLPYHPISLDCIKTFIKKLNSFRASAVAPTVRGAGAIAEMDQSLQPDDDMYFDEAPRAEVLAMGAPLGGAPKPVTSVEVSKELKLRAKRKKEAAADLKEATEEATATSSAAKVANVRGVCKFCDKPLTVDRAFNDHEKDGSKFGRCPLDPKPPPDPNAILFVDRALAAAQQVEVKHDPSAKKSCRIVTAYFFCESKLGIKASDNFTSRLRRRLATKDSSSA